MAHEGRAAAPGDAAFFYSSPLSVLGAVRAYSGLNGTGALLGSFDLLANASGAYDMWTQATLAFAGTAHSFDFTGSANVVGFDNISATAPVPRAQHHAAHACRRSRRAPGSDPPPAPIDSVNCSRAQRGVPRSSLDRGAGRPRGGLRRSSEHRLPARQ